MHAHTEGRGDGVVEVETVLTLHHDIGDLLAGLGVIVSRLVLDHEDLARVQPALELAKLALEYYPGDKELQSIHDQIVEGPKPRVIKSLDEINQTPR